MLSLTWILIGFALLMLVVVSGLIFVFENDETDV